MATATLLSYSTVPHRILVYYYKKLPGAALGVHTFNPALGGRVQASEQSELHRENMYHKVNLPTKQNHKTKSFSFFFDLNSEHTEERRAFLSALIKQWDNRSVTVLLYSQVWLKISYVKMFIYWTNFHLFSLLTHKMQVNEHRKNQIRDLQTVWLFEAIH